MTAAPALSDAERMDRNYRFQRYVYDATRTHYLIGRKMLIRRLQPAAGESVLEIGCGTAWNLARLGHAYPKGRLFGVDVSSAMLATAAASLKRQRLEHRVSLRQGDATNFDAGATFGIGQFDRVFFSYALSMIPGWEAALDNAAGIVAPGGELHIVDFGQCGRLPAAFKASLFAFLRHYTVTPRSDLAACARRIAVRHVLVCEVMELHRGYTDYIVLKRRR